MSVKEEGVVVYIGDGILLRHSFSSVTDSLIVGGATIISIKIY